MEPRRWRYHDRAADDNVDDDDDDEHDDDDCDDGFMDLWLSVQRPSSLLRFWVRAAR